jgi:hypothetical protein
MLLVALYVIHDRRIGSWVGHLITSTSNENKTVSYLGKKCYIRGMNDTPRCKTSHLGLLGMLVGNRPSYKFTCPFVS